MWPREIRQRAPRSEMGLRLLSTARCYGNHAGCPQNQAVSAGRGVLGLSMAYAKSQETRHDVRGEFPTGMPVPIGRRVTKPQHGGDCAGAPNCDALGACPA